MASLKDELRGFGKAAAGLAFPSNHNVAMTLSSNGDYWFKSMYAPFDGWIKVTMDFSSTDKLELKNEETLMHDVCSTGKSMEGVATIPVRKGERFTAGSELLSWQIHCIAIAARNA